MSYRHASRTEISELRADVIYVAPSRYADECVEYLGGEAGLLYTVSISADCRIADEDEINSIALELDPETPYHRAWEQIEEMPAVLNRLRSEGYDAAFFRDQTPDGMSEHETVMVFDAAAHCELVSSEAVAPSSDDDDWD